MAKMKLHPLGDRLLVEPLEHDETFAGGMLVLPETAKEKPQQGRVLAVGPGARDEQGKRLAMDINVGDRVVFARYAGTEVKVDASNT